MPRATQANRQAKLFVPSLGDDVLLLRRMRFSEALGRPYTISIEALSERDDLTGEEVLGTSAYVELTVDDTVKRHFHGYIVSLAQTGFESDLLRYQLTIAPYLWLLSRTSDCRIFQNKTVPEIIKEVCSDAGYTDVDDSGLSATYNPWEYCVQYRETTLNFIMRLMEQEGIYFWLESATDKEVLKLADSPSAHAPQEGLASMPFRGRTRGGTIPNCVTAWRTSKTLQPGAFAQTDFNPLTPRTDLFAPYQSPKGHAHDALEVFEFPGEFLTADDGSRLSTIRLQELHAGYERCDGETNARDLRAGRTFALEEFPREDQNREYLVTVVSIDVDNDDYLSTSRGTMKFSCAFTAIDAATQFRSPRSTPKPVVQGPQTAFVVSANDEDIQADEHARVRVKFHWDRWGDAAQGDTSCWIRVAQMWAGKKWGAQFMPRAGHEVVVEFLEGDPDRPLITGRVYNGEAKPPYDPKGADSKTMSTIKSLSSPDGGGFNELRFQDKKNDEQIFLHAQKRMDHRVRGNMYQTVLGTREEIIGNEDTGDSNRTVCNDINYHNKGGRFDKTDKKLNRTVVEDVVLDHQMNQTLKVAERLNINADEIAQEAQTAISLKSDTTTVQGATALNLKAGTVYIEGTQGIHLKCGGNFVVLSSSGVAINGTQVMINSGGSAQAAGDPLTIEAPEIEEPLDAAAAINDVSGARTGVSGAPRTRTRRAVEILRAPEPPPPVTPGTTGYGPNTADEITLVEVVEMTGPSSATSPEAPVESRRQYVNLPRTQSGREHKDQGRVIYLKARIRWQDASKTDSLAGKSVRFYFQPDGGNKAVADLHADLRAGYNSAGGAANTTVQTQADGWTPVVQFHVSRYGGDVFRPFATLESSDTGGLQGGDYTVWRKIDFEVDAMKRPSGVDYMDIASGVKAQFVAAHAAAFTEAVEIGRNSSPNHQRLTNYSDLQAFHRSCAQGSGERYFHLMYVDTVLTGQTQEGDMTYTNVHVPDPAGTVKLALDALQATFLPNASGWVSSATWTDPVSGRSGTIPLANFGAPTAIGEYARHRNQGGDFDRWEFDVRLNGSNIPAGSRVDIAIRFTTQEFLSGVQIDQTTTVAMRFRELRGNAGNGFDIANATLQTSIHESSHAFGLASKQLPSGAANPNFITRGGGHCNFNATCVMTPALHEHTAFCEKCADHLRARNLSRINVLPTSNMV